MLLLICVTNNAFLSSFYMGLAMAETSVIGPDQEEFHKDRLLELAEPPDIDNIMFEPASDYVSLIVSRILFAMSQEIWRLAIPLGDNFAAVLNEIQQLILPQGAYNTGYEIRYDREAKTLFCQRVEV